MGEKKIGDLVKADQFRTLKHIVLMRNESSHTVISDPREIKILAMDINGIYLRVPKLSCKKGQGITLFLLEDKKENQNIKVPVEGTIKNSIECVGKIIYELELKKDKEIKMIVVDLTQTDEKVWIWLNSQYSHLDDLLERMLKLRRPT